MFDFAKLFGRKQKEKKPAVMELVSFNKPGPYVNIDYMVQWRAEDGSLRIPQGGEKRTLPCNNFVAAGRQYSGWEQLCAEQTGEDGTFTDIYGRDVFAFRQRFPCFDSYDYLYEHRYYRWFYIREGDSLCCVYYTDEEKTIEVTEDVRLIADGAWKAMKEINWQA